MSQLEGRRVRGGGWSGTLRALNCVTAIKMKKGERIDM